MKSKCILLVDDDAQLVEALARRCGQLGLDVKTAHNTFTALTHLESNLPDIVCVDVAMPTGNGLSLCEMMTTNPGWSSIPIIVLTGKHDEETIKRCKELSANYVKKGNEAWSRVEAILTDILGNHCSDSSSRSQTKFRADNTDRVPSNLNLIDVVFEMLGADDGSLDASPSDNANGERHDWFETPPWVLCIEDDRDFSLALKLKLENLGISVVRAFEGLEGVKQAFTRPADAIILDYNLPNGQGDFVLRRLKSNPLTKNIPVIVLTGVKDQNLEQRMMSLGAAKYLTKPLDFDKLTSELRQYVEIQV